MVNMMMNVMINKVMNMMMNMVMKDGDEWGPCKSSDQCWGRGTARGFRGRNSVDLVMDDDFDVC